MATDDRQRGLSLSVLIVDDYADAAESLAALVRLSGHRAWVATDVPAALRAAAAARPDVIFLEPRMPGTDGDRLAEQLREACGSGPRPLIIAVSWCRPSTPPRKSEAIAFHILKPAQPALIMGLLRAYAEKFGPAESRTP